jgi:hypothetical protein
MIFIHYNNGRVLHGVVLALGDRMARIAVKGSDDAVEFRLVNQVWVSEDCEVVRLEFAERVAPVGSETDLLQTFLETTIRSQGQPETTQRVM